MQTQGEAMLELIQENLEPSEQLLMRAGMVPVEAIRKLVAVCSPGLSMFLEGIELIPKD